MQFFLGTHQPHWLGRLTAPLFVSARRLRGRKSLPSAKGPWALDSGGFSELSLFGRWDTTPEKYVAEVRRYRDGIGGLCWAAPQDWMCEPFVTVKTGKTVREHQRLTVDNFLALRRTAPDLPWVPVLQGWRHDDYLAHVEDYAAAGVDLPSLPLVGLGSVCRRQATAGAECLIRELHAKGIRLHGFGFKLEGLRRSARFLASADSLAWSFNARKSPPLPGCRHKNCANCERWALRWREKVLSAVARSEACLAQGDLFAA